MSNRLLHIINEVYHKPLLISKEGFLTIHNLIQKKLAGIVPDDLPEEEKFEVENSEGVTVIPVFGPIGKRLGMLEKICGATDVDDLRENLELAASYPDTETIVLLFDSPGGSASGIPELASFIADINKNVKPVVSIVDGMCCSAAYFLAAGSNEIYATTTSMVGSIGVYCALYDESRLYENAGVKPVLVSAGENKGQGLPGFPVDENFKASLQKEVDYLYGLFTNHVFAYRTDVAKDITADAWFGEEAMSRGLVDAVISHPSEVLTFEK